MLLDIEQRKILVKALERLFTDLDDFRTFLKNDVGKNLDDIVVDNLANSRSKVVDDAESFEWTISLIEALRAIAGPEVKAELDKLGTIEEIKEARFYDDCYVDRYPMVNRKKLRDKLRAAAKDDGKRILIVRGDRHSGKSHALRHIRHVAQKLGITLAEFALSEYATDEDLRPSELGPIIAHAIRWSPPQLDEKPSRWAVNFINYLAVELRTNPRRVWIAFDDFEKEKLNAALNDSIYEFIQLLCDRVAKQMPSVRLFLINYDRELPGELAYQIDREDVPEISEQDIVNFFVDFHGEYVRSTDLAAAARDAADRGRAVFSKMNGDRPKRLHQMRDALTAECEQLQGN